MSKPMLSKPTLPVLPESLLSRKPKLSGICPLKATLFMFLIPLPISLILGVVVHYLGIILCFVLKTLIPLARLLSKIGEIYGAVASIFAMFAMIAVVFGYPYITGIACGKIVGRLGKREHCRRPIVAGLAGALSGIFIYVVHLMLALRFSGVLHPTTITKEVFESMVDMVIYSTPWWMIALVVLEFALVVAAAAYRAYSAIGKSTYCETHSVWYTKRRQGRFPILTAEALIPALQTLDVNKLNVVKQVEEDNYPHLMIKTRACPSSTSCDAEIIITVLWKEQQPGRERSKRWADMMMPANFVYAIERKLNLRE